MYDFRYDWHDPVSIFSYNHFILQLEYDVHNFESYLKIIISTVLNHFYVESYHEIGIKQQYIIRKKNNMLFYYPIPRYILLLNA